MKITLTKIGREIEEKHKFKNLTVREKLLIHATILVINEQVLKHLVNCISYENHTRSGNTATY